MTTTRSEHATTAARGPATVLRRLALALLAASALALAAAAPAGAHFFQELTGTLSATNGIAIGADGNFWVAEEFSDSVVRMSPSGAVLGRWSVGDAPQAVVSGPGGRIWVAVSGASALAWFDAMLPAPLPNVKATGTACGPSGLAAGTDRIYASFPSDGCNGGASRVGSVAADGSGVVTTVAGGGGKAFDLEFSGGKLFVPDFDGNVVRRLAADLSAVETTVTMGSPGSAPDGIASDAAGTIWVTAWNLGRIDRYPGAQVGGVAQQLTPPAGMLVNPFGIVAGADGRIYVAGTASKNVVRLNADGSGFVSYPLPDATPFNIVNGLDGDFLVTDQSKTRIVRLINSAPRVTTASAAPTAPTSAALRAIADSRGNDTQVVFDYGPTVAYGATSAPVIVPAGAVAVEAATALGGLAPSTTYHVRARALNAEGAALGADLTFTTPAGLVDRDGDGISPPADCNDANRTIRPGARDIPGNRIDEDCSGRDAPYPRLDSSITYRYGAPRATTRFTELSVRPARAGSRVRVTCRGRGCSFRTRTRTVRRTVGRLNLTAIVRRSRLRPGARLEVQVTRSRTIGVVRRFTVRRNRAPLVANLCLRPNAARPARCPL